MFKNIKMPNIYFLSRSLSELILQGDGFLRLHVFMAHLKFLGNLSLPGRLRFIVAKGQYVYMGGCFPTLTGSDA